MARTPADGDETMDDARPVEERVGATLVVAGRYAVKRLLGEGGMGEVHECRDLLLERSVALKTIRRDRSRRQLEPRLIREGRVQAQLEHPSIVPVYELGQDATGVPYFTMRKLSGTPLDEVIARRSASDVRTTAGGTELFSRHQLLTAFSQICLALEFAHARGVLHRDLKPSNIMLGEFGEVYVLDWGIAKLAAADDPSRSAVAALAPSPGERQMTAAGSTLGTPGYMAPEQIAASSSVDARADVFALGAVLFELLTLEPLLDDAAVTARLRSRAATWDARPSVRAPKLTVPPEFDRICVRATALDPAERYPSARALHDEVEAYLDGVRDVGLRKKLAAVHLARAEATRTSDRDEALREVNRALAIAGEDRRALELLVDLLDTPSAGEAARAEVEAEGLARHRGSQPFVVIFTIPWFSLYPLILWKRGVVNGPLAALPIVMWAAATAAAMIVLRRKTGATATYPVILFMCAIAASSVVMGPLLLIPSIATAVLATHMLIQPRALRRVTYVWGVLAVLLPMLPVWLGLFTPYTFPDDATLIIHGITREMHAKNVGLLLTLTDVAFVVGVAIFATRFREQIDRARTEKSLAAWQLSKLLPGAPMSNDDGPPLRAHDDTPAPVAHASTVLATTASPDGDEGAPPVVAFEGARYVEGAEIARGRTTLLRVHDRLIGRDVAMKRTSDDGRDIRREALFQASVEHPFIPPIYDLGTDEAGPWFTTKLVGGKRLSDLIASDAIGGPRGRHERLSALAKVCLTIEFAHSRGVIHAGLYPGNVVLGDFGEVYVLGWSHAKRHVAGDESATGPVSQLTSHPRAAVDYLAPEQVDRGALDARTDVFALGALLSAVATAEMPEALAKICRRAMATDPKERYPSARSLHDALEAFLSADRDDELRRQLSAERLAKAERQAERALAEDDEAARVAALRELGGALALAPERASALRLLARLLKEQPRELPADVKRDLEGQIWAMSKRSAPVAALVYVVAFVVAFPIYSFVVGIRDPGKMIAVVASWAVAALMVRGQGTLKRLSRSTFPWAALAAWVAVALTSLVLGPWFMGPSLAISVGMVYALTVQPRWRYAMIALGGVAIALPALPVLFDASDVLALHGTFTPVFVIHGADYHPPAAFLYLLVLVNVASVLAAGVYAAKYRDLLDGLEAENRAKVHALSRLM